MHDEFEADILTMLPQLRATAILLTRDRASADDLLQDALVLALAGKHSFTPGTNLRGWMYRLMRNRLISLVRKRRAHTVSLDEPIGLALGVVGNQDQHMACRELESEMERLPAGQREALLLVGAAGYSYEDAAAAMGCSIGTVKSRVSRARGTLKHRLVGADQPRAPHSPTADDKNRADSPPRDASPPPAE